jgi:hypothetical protein
MTEEHFSESDLAPRPESLRRARRGTIERVAATFGVLAAGLWVGGLVALGACAAPMVFELTPAPYSGHAMGAAFARFDQIALGCAVAAMAAEVARTWAAGRASRRPAARVRRIVAVLMALGAAYVALVATPTINELHRAGVRRNDGAEGVRMEAVHKQAEAVGKAQVFLGLALVALHMATLTTGRARDEDEDEDEDALAPLPPGPFGAAKK